MKTMKFVPSRRFMRAYDRLFKTDPVTANVLLMLCKLAGSNGKVVFPGDEKAVNRKLRDLLLARFEDPKAYQLPVNHEISKRVALALMGGSPDLPPACFPRSGGGENGKPTD